MINNYEIIKENNEEVLYLYLDFSDEFAKFNFKDKTEKLENIIKKYIKNNQINFKGTKVAIIVGGITMGTILLSQPFLSTNNENINDNNIAIMETIENPNVIENTESVEEKVELENIELDNDTSNELENGKIDANKQPQNENRDNSLKDSEIYKQDVQPNYTEQVNNSLIENNSEIIEKEEKVEEKAENIVDEDKTYVTIYRSNGTVITLELEEYIIGVVGAEMPASFHDQALMAQSIIARTYALKAIQRNIALTDNSSTQNYKSNDELRNIWKNDYDYYYNKIKNAVEMTNSMYLTYNGNLIDAVYHSTSNGTTEDSKNVWGNSFPYLVSVDSPYDSTNKSFQYETFITYEQLSNKLQSNITNDTTFNILSYTSGNRVETIEINGDIYTGVKIRSLLGLRSADFQIEKSDSGVTFITKGYGHGVGLSQYGANGMAKNGYTYSQILKHYYQGVVISHL